MTQRYRSRRRAEVMRNRILFLLLIVVIILFVVIFVTRDRGEESGGLPVQGSSISDASQPGTPSSQSESQSENSSVASGEAPASSDPSSATSSTGQSQSASGEVSAPPSQPASATGDTEKDKYYETDLPMLVNPTNKIPDGFVPEVSMMSNGQYRFSSHAMAAYEAMVADAWEDGISLWVVSAYRDNAKQQSNFDAKVKEYQSQGMDAQQAYAATAQLIAVPGTSEHSIGLAIDFNSLYTSFEETEAFRWLYSHCADYGFVLRYPKDKVEITGISYEPWHYRYVGTNHARVIMDKKICLEEYLSGSY